MKEIQLTRGLVALVDDEDYELVTQYKWHASKRGPNLWYAAVGHPLFGGSRYLHRFIVGAKAGQQVDHIDRNGLNCCKSNLRIVTHSQNMMNRGPKAGSVSRYKGVCWHRHYQKWYAQISSKCIGYYDDVHEAARAYNEAAKKLHGEFAWLNPIPNSK